MKVGDKLDVKDKCRLKSVIDCPSPHTVKRIESGGEFTCNSGVYHIEEYWEFTSPGEVAEEVEPPADTVNHPTHYNSHPSGVECITVVEHMTFNVGNAIKYLWRAGLKDENPSVQDLKKAQWYISREIEKLSEH